MSDIRNRPLNRKLEIVVSKGTEVREDHPYGDESLKELQVMVAAYDGSVPFPEFAERYLQEHPSQYDLSVAINYIVPPNDPRGKP